MTAFSSLTAEYHQKKITIIWLLRLWVSRCTWHNALMFHSSYVWSKCNSWLVSSCKTCLQNTSSIVDNYWLVHSEFSEESRLLWQNIGRLNSWKVERTSRYCFEKFFLMQEIEPTNIDSPDFAANRRAHETWSLSAGQVNSGIFTVWSNQYLC